MNYKVEPSTKLDRRMKETKKRLNGIDLSDAFDAGPVNWFARSLGVFTYVRTDLNYWKGTVGFYPIATSFEVLEHLQNPLNYLTAIYDSLHTGGTLYLTTPVHCWLGKWNHHFKEYTEEELRWLLEEAGFVNVEITRMRGFELSSFGIRPVIRLIRDWMFGKTFFVKAVK